MTLKPSPSPGSSPSSPSGPDVFMEGQILNDRGPDTPLPMQRTVEGPLDMASNDSSNFVDQLLQESALQVFVKKVVKVAFKETGVDASQTVTVIGNPSFRCTLFSLACRACYYAFAHKSVRIDQFPALVEEIRRGLMPGDLGAYITADRVQEIAEK